MPFFNKFQPFFKPLTFRLLIVFAYQIMAIVVGAFESGIGASVVFGGVMTLAVVATTAKLAPKLRRLH